MGKTLKKSHHLIDYLHFIMSAVSKSDIKRIIENIPLMKIVAGPLDKDKWRQRQEEELKCLIALIRENKKNENDWFTIQCSPDGLKYAFFHSYLSYLDVSIFIFRWSGKCSQIVEHLTYTFDYNFEVFIFKH